MKAICCAAAMIFGWLSPTSLADPPWVLAQNGSISGPLGSSDSSNRLCVLRFGLPTTIPEPAERTRQVLRRIWTRNSVRYTETVFVTQKNGSAGNREAALIINIEGDNTSPDYADAWAELALEIGGQLQELELKDGLIWRRSPSGRFILGVLEIPDSGIARRSGDVLQFRGSIPPSLKGCMTVKVPLITPGKAEDCAWLEDIDFGRELRKLTALSTNLNQVHPIILSEDVKRSD